MKDALWQLFVKTGLPEVYLYYKEQQHDGHTAHGDSDTHHRCGRE